VRTVASESSPLHPKRTGSSVQSVVIDTEPALTLVPDRDAHWHDAITTDALAPTHERPFAGICIVEAQTPVEIKGTIPTQSNGDHNTTGRWYIKQDSHKRLLDARGVYYLTVYEPRPTTPIIAELICPAAIVDDVLEDSWHQSGRDEGTIAKLAWDTFIDREEVTRGD
jgi:hypothetical protein